MKIYLVDNKKINKYSLPAKVDEFFLITYKSPLNAIEATISLEAVDGKWTLRSNGSVNVMNGQAIIDSVAIEDYGFYYLKLSGQNIYLILFAMPSIETQLYRLDARNLKSITIGSNQKCNISHMNMITADLQSEIKLTDNGWYIVSGNKLRVGTYLNDILIRSAKLYTGDLIFINGLKIIWMGEFLLINNPNSSVVVNGIPAYEMDSLIDNTNYDPVSEEEQNTPQYKESDYFYHTPRIRESSVEVEIQIDPPPAMQNVDNQSFLLNIGSSLTMLASVFVSGYSVYTASKTGQRSKWELLPQIVTFGSMLLGSLLLPKIVEKIQKNRIKRLNEKTERKYLEYLKSKEVKINQELQKASAILKENNYDAQKCCELIMSHGRNMWSRETRDNDFLTVRLGLGNRPSMLKVNAPSEQFSVDENDLLEKIYALKELAKTLVNVPITFSFVEKRVSAFVFSCTYKDNYFDSLMAQIIAFHSANDLKIVILTDSDNEKRWDYIKILPHCFSDDHSVRFFASNQEEANTLNSYLENEFRSRKDLFTGKNKDAEVEINKNAGYLNFSPYYLVLTDNYQAIKNQPFIDMILSSDTNYGFSFVTLANSMKNLPNTCETFIEITEKDSCILEKEVNASNQIRFINEYVPGIDMKLIATNIANVPLHDKDSLASLPTMITFLDMFNVSKIEQFNILNRWKTNNPVNSIAAPVGVHANGEQFKLDLHEKFHGPHGLIAGMTGSGKSEFIITYILSMAVNYHPYEVNFVLIDYKGGGLAGAFENKETGVRIPHLTGTITNLDTSEMNRTLVSINSELKRRQRVFNETRDALGESTIDIYKYQRLYREGAVKEPMAHLFIISDEFAELKAQQPDFMDELISTARIGRSLGVHLILATQKPSGVVNDQIWSNSKFKVCLKVQDRSDSMEMLKKPDAASIKETGRFYLQVGYDDYFDIGQSGWAGAKYVPSNQIVKKIDDSLSFINNVGDVYKTSNDVVKKEVVNLGDQLTNIVRYINDLAIKENINTKKLWLDAIPSEIFVNDLKTKYNYKPQSYNITPVIGEYDNPKAQEQGLLTLDITHKGNVLIYGQTGSGKENLLSTIIWSSIVEHTPSEVNYYIIDCGAETLKAFVNMPHVGEVLTIDDGQKITDLIVMADNEIEKRKNTFSEFGGNYLSYLENSGQKMPLLVYVINNFDVFQESFAKLSDALSPLFRDGYKYGVCFIVTAISGNAVRSRTAQSFGNKIALQMPDPSDYRSYLNAPKGLFPAKIFGRGIFAREDDAVEFQTAYFCEPRQKTKVILAATKQLKDAYKVKAKKLATIPDNVNIESVASEITNLMEVPIGYSMATKEPYKYDFTAKPVTAILSNHIKEKFEFIDALLKIISRIENTNIKIVDFVNLYSNTEFNLINDNFDSLDSIINTDMNDTTKQYVYAIVGIGQYRTKMSPKAKERIDKIFASLTSHPNLHFIFIDNYKAYRAVQLENWYRSVAETSNGIWLGEGIGSQLAIDVLDVNSEVRNLDFPYMAFGVKQGDFEVVKYVTNKGETNEK